MTTPPIFTQHNATEVESESRSGHQSFVCQADALYSVGTLFCDCADVRIAFYPSRIAGSTDLCAVYSCEAHGDHYASALRCTTPAQMAEAHPNPRADAIFGWAERQSVRKVKASHIPTWGYSGKKHDHA